MLSPSRILAILFYFVAVILSTVAQASEVRESEVQESDEVVDDMQFLGNQIAAVRQKAFDSRLSERRI